MRSVVTVGRGDAYYKVTLHDGFVTSYHSRLESDGFVIQKNRATGVERPLRPAPCPFACGYETWAVVPWPRRLLPWPPQSRRGGRGMRCYLSRS